MKALRQLLGNAVAVGLLDTKPPNAIPVVGCLTGYGLRSCSRSSDATSTAGARVLHVRRVLIGGLPRPYGKTTHALGVVPLAERPRRRSKRIRRDRHDPLFSTQRGTPIDLHRWRSRHWTPALRAAGLPHRGPCAMRHTFASWAIAAGLTTFEIAATMGTSLEHLSKTYAHLLPDSAERARMALDMYLSEAAETAEGGGQ